MDASDARWLEGAEIPDVIARMAGELAELCDDADPLVVVGIANGGLVFGRRLAAALRARRRQAVLDGQVNITFQRDDIGVRPIPDVKDLTDLPVDLDDATVILADDVMSSGRTVRAALNELFDNGRPGRVLLAVLVDRGHRRLPLQPDVVGYRTAMAPHQHILVRLSDEPSPGDRIVVSSRPQ